MTTEATQKTEVRTRADRAATTASTTTMATVSAPNAFDDMLGTLAR